MNVIIYTKDDCVWCTKAKKLLYKEGYSYVEHKIGQAISKDTFKEMFKNQKTLPYIIIDSKPVGGYEQLVEWMATR